MPAAGLASYVSVTEISTRLLRPSASTASGVSRTCVADACTVAVTELRAPRRPGSDPPLRGAGRTRKGRRPRAGLVHPPPLRTHADAAPDVRPPLAVRSARADRHLAPSRYRHAVRDAAARGRLAAGPRRGRRRRPLRAQVPRRGTGAPGARGGGDRRRARARARPARARPRHGGGRRGARARRARPRDPGPDRREHGPQPRRRLPARVPAVLAGRRLGAHARPRRGDRLARRAGDERRPDGTQPEPALLARASLADRPRSRALPPARRARGERRRTPFPAGRGPRAAPVRRADRRGRRAPRCSGSTAPCSRRSSRSSRRSGSWACPRRRTSTTWSAGWRRPATSCRRRSMPGVPSRSAFSYAIVRVVPRVERGERFNVGVVLFCPELGFLAARTQLDERRLAALAPDVAPDVVRPYLDAVVRIAEGDPAAGPIAALPPGGALRLARRAVEHDAAALAGAHRALRRPREDARTALRRRRRLDTALRGRSRGNRARRSRPPRRCRPRRRCGEHPRGDSRRLVRPLHGRRGLRLTRAAVDPPE